MDRRSFNPNTKTHEEQVVLHAFFVDRTFDLNDQNQIAPDWVPPLLDKSSQFEIRELLTGRKAPLTRLLESGGRVGVATNRSLGRGTKVRYQSSERQENDEE